MANAPSNKMQRRIQVILFCMAVVGFSILLGRLYYLPVSYTHLLPAPGSVCGKRLPRLDAKSTVGMPVFPHRAVGKIPNGWEGIQPLGGCF